MGITVVGFDCAGVGTGVGPGLGTGVGPDVGAGVGVGVGPGVGETVGPRVGAREGPGVGGGVHTSQQPSSYSGLHQISPIHMLSGVSASSQQG